MTSELKNPFQFWEELKQRKVVRAMMVYIAGAFALLEASDIIFPRVGLPSWSVNIIILLLAAGLIAVIILTWIYDITPEGIKRTDDLGQAEAVVRSDVKYIHSDWQSTLSQSLSVSPSIYWCYSSHWHKRGSFLRIEYVDQGLPV